MNTYTNTVFSLLLQFSHVLIMRRTFKYSGEQCKFSIAVDFKELLCGYTSTSTSTSVGYALFFESGVIEH